MQHKNERSRHLPYRVTCKMRYSIGLWCGWGFHSVILAIRRTR